MSEYRVIEGDCLAVLREVDAGSVQTCITSPPYYGLRDYGHDGQIGLEETPEAYVDSLVAVFREVRRVLRDDGTLWLNLGDSYSDVGRSSEKRNKDASGVVRPVETKECERCGSEFEGGRARRFCSAFCGGSDNSRRSARPGALKAKDLLGIPWMVAFALRADGWYLRSDIIWAKPNPMPESVTDRPTKAHEYLFLLSKSPRYFYDAGAIRETWADEHNGNPGKYEPRYQIGSDRNDGNQIGAAGDWDGSHLGGRNRRSVWTVATQPFPGAHFATFPPKLIEPCVLAGSSPQACAECGAPWSRVVEKPDFSQQPRRETAKMDRTDRTSAGQAWQNWRDANPDKLLGWEPTCDHDAGTGRCTVLDPFNGAGTTGMVTLRHDRDYIGIEINPEYAGMARDRIYDDGPLLNVEKAA